MKQRNLADKCMKKFTRLGYDERDTDAASSDVYYYFRGVEVCRLTPKSTSVVPTFSSGLTANL